MAKCNKCGADTEYPLCFNCYTTIKNEKAEIRKQIENTLSTLYRIDQTPGFYHDPVCIDDFEIVISNLALLVGEKNKLEEFYSRCSTSDWTQKNDLERLINNAVRDFSRQVEYKVPIAKIIALATEIHMGDSNSIELLNQLLDDDDAEKREIAGRGLIGLCKMNLWRLTTFNVIKEGINSGNQEKKRFCSALFLKMIGSRTEAVYYDRSLITLVNQLLINENNEIKMLAADATASLVKENLHDGASLTLLNTQLRDKDNDVRLNAIRAIKKIYARNQSDQNEEEVYDLEFHEDKVDQFLLFLFPRGFNQDLREQLEACKCPNCGYFGFGDMYESHFHSIIKICGQCGFQVEIMEGRNDLLFNVLKRTQIH